MTQHFFDTQKDIQKITLWIRCSTLILSDASDSSVFSPCGRLAALHLGQRQRAPVRTLGSQWYVY